MTSQNLANLAKTGQLKAEPPSRKEFDGLVRSAHARLKDAHLETLSIESRFDLGSCTCTGGLALAWLPFGKPLHRFSMFAAYTGFWPSALADIGAVPRAPQPCGIRRTSGNR